MITLGQSTGFDCKPSYSYRATCAFLMRSHFRNMHVPQNANIIIILGNKITLKDYVKLLHTLYGEIPRPVCSVCESVNCNL